MECTPCPDNCATCNMTTEGVFSVLSAAKGFVIDKVNNVCYKCATNQYWDPATVACVDCSENCLTCSLKGEKVSMDTAAKGYLIDAENNVCYKCASNQYWNPVSIACVDCPEGCLTCSWKEDQVMI